MQTAAHKKRSVFDDFLTEEPSQQAPLMSGDYQFVSGQLGVPVGLATPGSSKVKFHYGPITTASPILTGMQPEAAVLSAVNMALTSLSFQAKQLAEIQQNQARLSAKLDIVLQHLEELEKSRSFTVQLETLTPEGYQLIRPISAVLEGNGDDFTASFLEANISGTGDTEADALSALKDALVSTFEALDHLANEDLGPLPARQKVVLTSVMRRLD